ncbi:glycosyltransferase family 2 protein [Actinoalloteichus caeruleus]|uniref:glycosyltransferase family 2 protein n=1 Tax=Actinoalloteichus cyanogriseus TaxID=2893586 RepID=UPI0004ABA04C|nr:glycosyltransferase family 2 protein [Actinoalloteichus caeruleus]
MRERFPTGETARVTGRRLVSLVVPACDEAANAPGLVAFYRQVRNSFPDLDFELVVVDDGSEDGTAQAVVDQLGPGDIARVAVLSRNFGSHAAVTAGFQLCRGDAAITLSADLQEPLSAVADFLAGWRSGHDIVWGVRRVRSVRRGPSNLSALVFSWLLRRLGQIPNIPEEGPSQVLVSRAVLDVLARMPERNRNIMGLVAWVGFAQATITFDQRPRPAGTSKWTTSRKIKLALDSFVAFSYAPMRAAMVVGAVLGAVGVLLGASVVLTAPLTELPVGWPLVIAVMCVIGGGQLAFLGLLGEYLWRAGDDGRGRPVFVVDEVRDVGEPPGQPPTASLKDSRALPGEPAAGPGADVEEDPAGRPRRNSRRARPRPDPDPPEPAGSW